MKTYVIKYQGQYCAFGSYSKARLVSEPSKASLYSKEQLARNRLSGPIYIDAKSISLDKFELVEITLQVVKERTL